MSGERAFVGSVQRVVASPSDRFTQLVKLTNLKPESDFRYADLSGADLRCEDLRRFDFSHAAFRGALVAGALFNDTVSPRQLAMAEKSSRAVIALIGEGLSAVEDNGRALFGPDVVVPRQFVAAAQKVGVDQARRHRETGVHLGDSSDLARRRMALPFRLHDRTITNARAVVVLFEPADDLDFDTLSAVRTRFRRAQKTPMIFLIPDLMDGASTGQAILKARLRNLPSEAVLDLSIGARGIPTLQRRALAEHSRDRGLGFLAAMAQSEAISLPPLVDDGWGDRDAAPWLLEGARNGRRGLYSAITADLQQAEDDLRLSQSGSTRRHLFVRRDLYDQVPAETLTRTLAPRHGVCALSVFNATKKMPDAEYYLATGSPSSPLWQLAV